MLWLVWFCMHGCTYTWPAFYFVRLRHQEACSCSQRRAQLQGSTLLVLRTCLCWQDETCFQCTFSVTGTATTQGHCDVESCTLYVLRKRNQDPVGDESLDFVREGNAICVSRLIIQTWLRFNKLLTASTVIDSSWRLLDCHYFMCRT